MGNARAERWRSMAARLAAHSHDRDRCAVRSSVEFRLCRTGHDCAISGYDIDRLGGCGEYGSCACRWRGSRWLGIIGMLYPWDGSRAAKGSTGSLVTRQFCPPGAISASVSFLRRRHCAALPRPTSTSLTYPKAAIPAGMSAAERSGGMPAMGLRQRAGQVLDGDDANLRF